MFDQIYLCYPCDMILKVVFSNLSNYSPEMSYFLFINSVICYRSQPEPVFVDLLSSPGIDSQPGIDSSDSIPGL
jgi:hypothetical protein